ncbi:MAG: GyrI-like domain-containing protein [Candidatus Berkelbacteria bacterium]|nr:GyrI-like domain-containing protein [Candidatus Berkelbacteria bacterium]MCR4307010.1 GyrI-like domain-containing protein [Candidatus Berkelbacteria bacterium]
MKAFVPQIIKLPDRKVVTVTSFGDPNKVMEPYMKALYGAVYGAKMGVYKPKGIKMELGKLAARWPDAHLKPKSDWTGIWGVPVPDYVSQKDLPQKDPKIKATIDTWKGGEYAEVLYIGPYADEGPTIKDLHKFIDDSGYKLVGMHEEEYLSRPGPKAKTIIRNLIEKR